MYLPALPAIAAGLGAEVSAVQMTLTAYFIGFGLAQLVYGPWADRSGRKPPLYVGLALFLLASVGCLFAPTIGWLIAFRLLQGLGGAAVMVVPRAIIRDMHTGTQATRLMAMLMVVISVSPMLAPLAGSGLIAVWDWRAIFAALTVAAVASLAMLATLQPETLAPGARVPVNLRNLLRGCRVLLGDRGFMGLTFIGALGMSSFFVFIASAAFVFTGQYGLSPTGFSLAFAVNALGFFGASQFAAGLGERHGMATVVRRAVMGFALFTCLLLPVTLAGWASLPVLVGFLFCANACLGLVIPSTMVMALDGEKPRWLGNSSELTQRKKDSLQHPMRAQPSSIPKSFVRQGTSMPWFPSFRLIKCAPTPRNAFSPQ
jgi:DHA1 family bicyclomycin/chloramphenicol resistance-like MFS transporter